MTRAWNSRVRASALFLGVLATVGMAGAGAPVTDPRGINVEQRRDVATWPKAPKRWALVIGVDRYADTQITTLGGASNDARSIADALVRYAGFPPDQVILLASDQPPERQPTRGNILRRLSNLAQVVPQDGLLFMSFAGHGMERNEQAFLLPSDSQVSNDVELLEETAINVKEVKSRIHKIGVGQVVMVLDACRNDPVGRGDQDNPLTASYLRGFDFDVRNREVTAFATLYATAVGARAYEYSEKHQGYFTWELIEGLKGGAANANGEVTLSALVGYVQSRVPKHVLADLGSGKEQKPFAVVSGYQADELIVAVAAPTANAAAPAAAPPRAADADPAAFELAYWETIENSTDAEDFKSYLSRYPNGRFADLARRRSQARSTATLAPNGNSAGTRAPTQSVAPSAEQNGSPGGLVLSNVLILGVDLGIVEVGTFQNGASAQLLQPLGTARDLAASSGVATDLLDNVLTQLRGGALSQGQYPNVLAARQTFERAFDRTGNCGRPILIRNVFGLGTELGFLDVVTYQGGDANYMTQILNLAIQYAAASGLSTGDLQDMLRRVTSGASTREQYQPLQNLQAQLIQAANARCSW